MNAPNKSGWKPSAPLAGDTESATFTGNRALMLEEPLIFEIGHIETTGVDLPEPQADAPSRLGGLERTDTIGLPGLSEPECVRHYTRLSRQNYAIDLGLFPLGSCTMKYNPRINEYAAAKPGMTGLHPLQVIGLVSRSAEFVGGRLRVEKMSFQVIEVSQPLVDQTAGQNGVDLKQPAPIKAFHLTLNGIASNYLAVSKFIIALRDSGLFESVELKSSERTEMAGGRARKFFVDCVM